MTLANGQLRSSSGYLPTEVLSQIFLDCLDIDVLDCIVPHPLSAPLVLTWVCRLWRDIALNTHRLWTGVTFARKAERMADDTRLLELWIARSGTLPFGVRLFNSVDDGQSLFSINTRRESDLLQTESMTAFIGTLLRCSKRWRVLEVIVPEIPFALPLLDALTKDSAHLEHLGISSQYLGIYETPSHYNFSLNKELQSVRLVTPLIRAVPSGNNDTFANLIHLELHFCPSMQDCLNWLDMAPNLHHLILRLYSTTGSAIPFEERRVRHLPNLHSLEITCFAANSQFEDPGLLLDVLELPSLFELDLSLNYLFNHRPWPHLTDLLVRSGASLESLILQGTPMREEEIIECLRLSPDIEYLDISLLTDNILLALTPRLIADNEPSGPNFSRALAIAPRQEGVSHIWDESTELDNAQDGDRTSSASTQCNADTGTEIETEDTSRYTLLCPNLCFLEAEDVDLCSLQAIYEMMVSRCEEVYNDIRDYVNLTTIKPTPSAFKTLDSVILPCDPLYGVLSHPLILDNMERIVYF